jgi:IS5 family transposase
MFRVVLLGQWHDLSDEELEHALRVRLDFLLFCGFTLSGKVPDRATINAFRNKLVSKELLPRCLHILNNELKRIGIKVNSSKLIVDATIIESAARPRNITEVNNDDEPPTTTSSKDPDAAWTVKGKQYYYGYKEHVVVEAEEGFIEDLKVTAANVHDSNLFIPLLKGKRKITEALADKAYASSKNRDFLNKRGITDKILRKAVRGNSLSEADKLHNAKISTNRFVVEQQFGTKKRKFAFHRTRYFGIARVAAQAFLKAICFNLLKARNLLFPRLVLST